MPLNISWKIERDALLVVATASGELTREDIDACLEAVPAEGAVGYRVIFDARAASCSLRPKDLVALSRLAKDRKRDKVSDGRIALVVGSDAEREMAAFFADRTDGQRPCRLFGSVEEARAWLDETPRGF